MTGSFRRCKNCLRRAAKMDILLSISPRLIRTPTGTTRRPTWACGTPKSRLRRSILEDEHLWAIDSRIAPLDGEYVLMKKRASAFSGTDLAGYLRAAGVDTILVTGVTVTACVRTTICDGLAEGFRTIAVKEAIGDRVPGAMAWNLFDIDAKFADVESTQTCVSYLETINRRNED